MIYQTNTDAEYFMEERCFIIEVLNANTNQNLSIAQARVEPSTTTKLHQLIDTDEYYYILEGKGVVELDGTIQKNVSKGDVVYIKAGVSQRITNIGDEDLTFLCICTPRFRPDAYVSLE